MIVDLRKFLDQEQPYWAELETRLNQLDEESHYRLDITQIKRLHYLYQRVSADLAKVMTFTAEPESRRHLETLVARAYSEIHATGARAQRLHVWHWFTRALPQTVRHHHRAFWLAVLITLAGAAFGSGVLLADPQAKAMLLPFAHLQGDPSERVAQEEQAKRDRLEGHKATFSTYLMTHNIKVSIFVFALGMTWGLGTIMVLFYNGVILGAVVCDYVQAGETAFLVGWLLPHGSVEIPAILLAGQAGLLLAGTLIGQGTSVSLAARLRAISGDLVTLLGGVALLLVWAGVVEAFLSQYHEPVMPYALKIAFGILQLALLTGFLMFAGKGHADAARLANAR